MASCPHILPLTQKELLKLRDIDESRVDEEYERELSLTSIRLCIQTSLEALQSSKMEMRMLEEVTSSPSMVPFAQQQWDQEDGTTRVEGRRPPPRPTAWSGPLLSESGAPLRPFVITSKREALQDQVFRPGHNLPTMTVEEYLEREVERGNILSGGT
jgi:immunoglobulin-binding protein 1